MLWNKRNKKRIYLDYASATSVRPEILQKMLPYFTEQFGNAGAIHREGQAAKHAVEEARGDLARMLRVQAKDVLFVSGGTEANDLAIAGYIEALHAAGRAYTDMEILTLAVEHPSVLETVRTGEARGISVRYIPIDTEGRIIFAELAKLLSPRTTLVTLAYANSETGVVQDIKRVSREVKKYNQAAGTQIKVHTDAAQAPLWLPCQLDMLGVDMLSLDAGKCYGPKGLGVLVMRQGTTLTSQLHGGNQERGLRAGTENTALIVGGVAAFLMADAGREARVAYVQKIREYGMQKILGGVAGTVLNGSSEHRLANNINISMSGYDTEYAVVVLDAAGVAASTRSACGGADTAGSHVVRAMTHDDARAQSTLRLTLGEETVAGDIDRTVEVLQEFVRMMQTTHNTK